MLASLRPRSAYDVMAATALFVALGSGAYAASQLPEGSVGTKQLKKGAVSTPKLHKNAVTSSKIASNAVRGSDLKESSLGQVPSSAALGGLPASAFARAARIDYQKGASKPYGGATCALHDYKFTDGHLTLRAEPSGLTATSTAADGVLSWNASGGSNTDAERHAVGSSPVDIPDGVGTLLYRDAATTIAIPYYMSAIDSFDGCSISFNGIAIRTGG